MLKYDISSNDIEGNQNFRVESNKPQEKIPGMPRVRDIHKKKDGGMTRYERHAKTMCFKPGI